MKTKPTPEYAAFIMQAANDLAENEYWFVNHPDGPLPETASKVITNPVIVFCDALGVEWDDARDQGYFLDKGQFPHEQTLDAKVGARKVAA